MAFARIHPAARVAIALAVSSCTFAVTAAPARGAAVPALRLTRVADLGGTTALAVRAGDPTLYVAEQVGRVRAVRNGRMVARAVLDLTGLVRAGGEQGLLGLAFSPDGTRLYSHYTNRDGNTQVDEFSMLGRAADPDSRRTVLTVEQPQPNHNGGQLAFGPDGYLYLGLGDGGAGGDEGAGHAPGGNGQSLQTLLGKILRIDPTPSRRAGYTVPADNPFVGVAGARPEIWAYGLRNPWRFSFDAVTGDLWVADVGQSAWEEIDFASATNGRNAGRGLNFGWNRLEASAPFRGQAPKGTTAPVAALPHDDGWKAVVGGFVYRGSRIPELTGVYLFTDYSRGDVFGLAPTAKGGFRSVDFDLRASGVSSFGEGPDGELYLLSQPDGLLRLRRARG